MLDNIKSGVLVHGLFDEAMFDQLASEAQEIFVLEGRPNFQTSKQSIAAFNKRKITPTLISDNMAGFLFYKKMVTKVCISYQAEDSRAVLSPIGSLILAVLGKKHKVPVYLFPSSEGLNLLGKPSDLCLLNGKRIMPKNFKGYVPLVEWVAKKYITKSE